MRLIRRIIEGLFRLLGLPYLVAKQVIKFVIILGKKSIEWISMLFVSLGKIVSYLFNGLVNIVELIYNFFSKIIKFIFDWLGTIIKFIFNGLGIIIKYIPIILVAIGKWFIEAVKESIAQIFTLLGFFIAWLTLTGSAKDIVGIAIIGSTVLWLLTMGLRKEDG
tara:strand:+ start:345 stop:836 length:492 start_codon:yes stop_codon:yes gene_type:complete